MEYTSLRISELEFSESGWFIRFNAKDEEFHAMRKEMRQSYILGVYWVPDAFGAKRGGWFVPNHILFEYSHKFNNFNEMIEKAKNKHILAQKATSDRQQTTDN